MKILSKIFVATAVCIGMAGCETTNQKLSDVVVLVKPSAENKPTLYAGESMLFSVELLTTHDYVASLVATSFDPMNGIVPFVDETFNQKEVELSVPFTAPALNRDSVDVLLTFTVTDNLGNRAETKRTVLVLNKAISMPEKTGIVLYRPGAGLPDALEFANVSHPFILTDAPDPERADLYISIPEDGNQIIDWRSNTQAKFLRNNSFDYASASPAAIQTVFESSVKTDMVSNVKVNDIIIVGHGSKAQGVFYVANILNQSGTESIQLAFKGIQN